MAIVINAIITVILLYYAYKYASGGTMIIKHPFKVGEYYECNNNLSFMIFSEMTAMVFLGPLSLVKYAILHVVDVTPMGQEMGWCDDDIPDFHIMESIYAYLFSLYLSRLDDDCQILPTNTLFLGGV